MMGWLTRFFKKTGALPPDGRRAWSYSSHDYLGLSEGAHRYHVVYRSGKLVRHETIGHHHLHSDDRLVHHFRLHAASL